MHKLKCSNEQIIAICKDYGVGVSFKALGQQYNVEPYTIKKYLLRNNVKIRSRNSQLDKHYFDVIDTERKAYWFGYLIADAHINNKGLFKFTLSSKDKSIIKEFTKDIKYIGHIKEYIKTSKNKTYYSCNMQCVNRTLVKGLIDNGFNEWRHGNPIILTKLAPTLLNHFIRGFFDGDGSISTYTSKRGYKRFSIWLCEHANATQSLEATVILLNKICNMSLQSVKCVKKKNGIKSNGISVRWSGNQQLMRLYNWLYSNYTICLQRKKNVFEQLNTIITNRKPNFTSEQLYDLYHNQHLNIYQIADMFNKTAPGIRYWFNKYNLARRSYRDAALMTYKRRNTK